MALAADPVTAVFVVLAALTVVGCAVGFPKQFFVACLIAKPIIDLGWGVSLLEVPHVGGTGPTGEQILNPQGVVALLLTGSAASVCFRRLPRVPVPWPVLLLAGSAAMTCVLNPTLPAALQVVRLASGVAVFFLAYFTIRGIHAWTSILRSAVLVMIVPLFIGILQFLGRAPYYYWDYLNGSLVGRVSAGYPHPLGFLYFLNVLFLGAAYLWTDSSSRLWKAALGLFWALAAFCIALSWHRTAWVVFGLQLGTWLLLRRRYLQAGIALAAVSGLCLLFRSELLVFYSSLVGVLSGRSSLGSPDFLRGRGAHWSLFIQTFVEAHPAKMIFGHGISAAAGYVFSAGFWVSSEPHNDFLRMLVAHGLVGLLAYLAFLLKALARASWLARHGDQRIARFGALWMVSLIGSLVFSLTTEPSRYPSGMLLVFALSGVGFRVAHRGLTLALGGAEPSTPILVRRSAALNTGAWPGSKCPVRAGGDEWRPRAVRRAGQPRGR